MSEDLRGLWIHKKGSTYEVLGVGKHSETLEDLVVYRNMDGDIWIRPKDMFLDGRFKRLEENV